MSFWYPMYYTPNRLCAFRGQCFRQKCSLCSALFSDSIHLSVSLCSKAVIFRLERDVYSTKGDVAINALRAVTGCACLEGNVVQPLESC